MDGCQQTQLERIIAFELDLALRAVPAERERIFARNASRGLLQSGGTIKEVLKAKGQIADQLLTSLVKKCGAVSREPAAFNMIKNALTEFFEGLDESLLRLVTVVDRSKNDTVRKATLELMNQTRADLFAKLEIEEFAFTGSNHPSLAPPHSEPVTASKPPVNVGGKPLAAHWDDMWSSVAVQLYSGDLQPKTQADIERAMTDWFIDKQLDVGESTIRGRARALWDKLQSAN